jgi:hypothetical protein
MDCEVQPRACGASFLLPDGPQDRGYSGYERATQKFAQRTAARRVGTQRLASHIGYTTLGRAHIAKLFSFTRLQ